jgi:hypothetical protein
MKTLRIIILGLACSGFINHLQASDIEIALSSDTAQFTFRSDSSLIGWGGADLGFGLFYNEADDVLGQISLIQSGQPSEQNPLTLGVGVKAYLGRLDPIDESVVALGIGGEIRYTFAGVTPMAIYLRGYFAPDITSFSDTKEIREYQLGFQIEVLPQTMAFVGVRNIEVDTKSFSDYELDDDKVHVGVRLTF